MVSNVFTSVWIMEDRGFADSMEKILLQLSCETFGCSSIFCC